MDKEISLLATTLEKYLVMPFSSTKGVSMVKTYAVFKKNVTGGNTPVTWKSVISRFRLEIT
jgi:hypothetical protein